MSRKRPSPCKAVEPENEGTKVSRTIERTQTRPSLITHWVSKPIKESKSREETVNTQKQPQNPPNEPEIPHNDDGDNSKSSAESALIQSSKTPEESEQIPVSEFQKETEGKCLTHWNSGGRHMVRCDPCFENPVTVKLYAAKQLPLIVQKSGVLYRSRTVENHFKTKYHKEALKSQRFKRLPVEKVYKETLMGSLISAANEELANKMGQLVLHVFNDAKKLTLSAYSWPSRIVASRIASNFSFNSESEKLRIDFQYINPTINRELLEMIVDAHRETFADQIKQALALSLRCDGSVDRTQVDKMYIMLKVITSDAAEELFFVGAKEPSSRGAVGALEAIKDSCSEVAVGSENLNILHESSSIVTDGTNMNSGERGGLWTLLEELRQQNVSERHLIPLLKVWCSVHRSQLAWKSITETVSELKILIQDLKGFSTYFHTSGVRTRELKQIGDEHKLTVKRFPEHFQIRFTEFLYEMIDSFLSSWHATALYFEKILLTKRQEVSKN